MCLCGTGRPGDSPSGIGNERPENPCTCAALDFGQHAAQPSGTAEGANVNFFEIVGPDQIFERTFERGVEDFTYACGTGTGSVVAVLTEKGLCSGKNVKSFHDRGDLLIDVVKDKGRITDLYLSGPAVIVAEGETGEIIG